MVNPEKRQVAKRLIERFLACEITNDEFNDAFPRDKLDHALEAVYSNLWSYYDERHTHKLDGRRTLLPEARKLFDRCVVFLGSGLEYEWPSYSWVSPKHALMRLVGVSGKINKKFERFKANGHFEFWPFIREADYHGALVRK